MNEDVKNIKTKKKKVKKRTKIILGAILGFIVITAYKIISPYYIIPREIQELNENVSMPFEFAAPLEEYDFDEAEWEKDEGYRDIRYTNSKGDSLRFNGYPDLSNSYKLTYIRIRDPQISVFGIHIGDDMKKVAGILKKYDYKYDKSDIYSDYNKGRVKIIFGVDRIVFGTDTEEHVEETIKGISIYLKSSDWFRKGYYK